MKEMYYDTLVLWTSLAWYYEFLLNMREFPLFLYMIWNIHMLMIRLIVG